jgi:hypothetical protein
MKITTEVWNFKKLAQRASFVEAYRHRFEPGGLAAEAGEELVSTVTDLQSRTVSHAAVVDQLNESGRRTKEARRDVRQDMDFLYGTAAAAAVTRPGFDGPFQKLLIGDARLISAAQSALKDAAARAEVFLQYAMPPDFTDVLAAKTQRLVRARTESAAARVTARDSQKALNESLLQATAAAHRFDAIMSNTFRNDRIVFEAWEAACYVPRKPATKKKKKSVPENPPTEKMKSPPTPEPPPQTAGQQPT